MSYLGNHGYLNWIGDALYVRILYALNLHKKLNLTHPKTFNEKLQWLKLYDRNPLYTKLVDKYEVKNYVANIIGEKYIIPTLGVWNHFDEIPFDQLPNRFVLKCTHNSGGIVIVKDKNSFNKAKARKKLERCLKLNFYWAFREYPYKNVRPRIIAEEYKEDSVTHDLRDYKFFCFNGVVKALFVATDRNTKKETKFDFFDDNFSHLPFTNGHPNADILPEKPKTFEEMKEVARKLSTGMPQVRCDLYEVDGKVFFGEMTFFHWSGLTPFKPEEWDETFGSWITLPQIKE